MANYNERMQYTTLVSINLNLVKIIRLLEEIREEGLRVKTQQSHV